MYRSNILAHLRALAARLRCVGTTLCTIVCMAFCVLLTLAALLLPLAAQAQTLTAQTLTAQAASAQTASIAYVNYPPSQTGAWPGVNLTWAQHPTGSTHFVLENQNNYTANGRTALANGNLPLLDTALQGIRWGLDRQKTSGSANPPESAPGSIPGNGTSSVSHQAHSLLVFMSQLSEFTRELVASPYAARYASTISLYKARLLLSTNWIMRPDVNAASVAYNKKNAHRRFMAAAVLYAAAYFNPTAPNYAAIVSRANAYIADGLTCQFPAGTYAVLPARGTRSADGFAAPAPILFPAGYTPNPDWTCTTVTTVPSNSAGTFSLEGCTPETSGWDVAYTEDAVSLADYAAACCPDRARTAQIYAFCDRALKFQQSRLIEGGTNISVVGCWRMGHESSPNDPTKTKQVGLGSITHGFDVMSVHSADPAQRACWQDVSDWLRGRIARLPNPPAAPGGLVAASEDGGASFAWNATGSTNAYTLYLRQAGQVPLRASDASLADTACAVLDLTGGQSYLASVSAIGAGGEGPRSAEITVQAGFAAPPPPAGPVPAAPANIRLHPSSTYVRAIADAVPGVLYYTLYVKVGNGAEFAVPKRLVSANYGLRDMANGVPVTCAFTATNAAGEGPRSAVLTTTPTAP